MTLVLTLLSISSAFASNESPKIENPQAQLLTEEAELLKRVVKITSEAGAVCTGTWIDDGIVITADHCFPLINDKMQVWINGVQTRLLQRVKFTEHPDARVQKLLWSFGHTLPQAIQNPRDTMLWLLDRKPLESLKLPTNALPIADASPGKIAAGVQVLIAGYGLDSLLTTGKVGTLGAALVKSVETDAKQPYSMLIRAKRSVMQGTLCVFGDFIKFCRRRVQFYAKSDQSEATILQGDSGGPAFRKNEKGQWELLGVASTIGKFMSGAIDLKMSYTIPPLAEKVTEVIPVPKDELRSDNSVRKNLIARETDLIKALGMDPDKPIMSSISITQTLAGEVDDFHVNLSEPKLHTDILKGLLTLKLARDTESSAGITKGQ